MNPLSRLVLSVLAPAFLLSSPVRSAVPDFSSLPAVGDTLTPETRPLQDGPEVVRMGIAQFSWPNSNYAIILPTVQALQKTFGRDRLYVEIISGREVDSDRFDLVLASAGTYRRFTHRGTRDIASLVSERFPDPNRAEGSVFAVLDRRRDLRTPADLRQKRLIVTGLQAFSGHHIALGELLAEGFRPERFFSETIVIEHDMVSALAALRSGQGDAAVLRTCFLEDMQAKGLDVSDIRVIGARRNPGFACRTSTALYPGWTVFITPHARPAVARAAASTLMTLPPDAAGLHWTVATDFTPVDELFRELRVGPYEYLQKWSVADFVRQHWEWFLFLIVAALGLVWHTVRTDELVALRTRQLREAWDREKALKARADEAARHLDLIRRRSLIGQMSSMIAHELRQPLATIVNYSQGMLRLLDREDDGRRDAMLFTGLSTIRSEAGKADGIVTRVRAYARNQQAETERCTVDLAATARKSADTLCALGRWSTPVRFAPCGAVPVWADPLEIEVALVNLIRNALEAADGIPGAVVTVSAAERMTPTGPEARVSVTNPAPDLSDEAFERLNGITGSSKTDGLGLGLSIVRGIAAGHAGRLVFVRTPDGGVRAELRLPAKSS